MTGYTPRPPTGTPNPCGGEPYRVLDGVVQCINEYVAQHPATGSDGLALLLTALFAGVFMGLGITALHKQRTRDRQ